MDELKRRILEQAGIGEEVIKDFEEHDKKIEYAKFVYVFDTDFEKLLKLAQVKDSFSPLNRTFIIFCHSNEPWKDRRNLKKALKKSADNGKEHIRTCAKCQELLPHFISALKILIVQK